MAGFGIEANWWLYVVLFIAIFILVAINVYILVIWQHPDDKNEAYFPKALVVSSLTLAQLAVVLLPIDAANNSGNVECNQSWSDVFCGSIDMKLAWFAVFILIFAFAFFLIPFTIFFYEEDDSFALTGRSNCRKAFCAAAKYMVVVAFIVVLVVVLLFVTSGFSDVPVKDYEVPILLMTRLERGNKLDIVKLNGLTEDLTSDRSVMNTGVLVEDERVELRLSFPVYVMALMSFVGWFLFVVFGGLGLPGIPIDSIRGFTNRPKRLDRAQVAALELGIQSRCKDLVEVGDLLKATRQQDRREEEEGVRVGFFERRRRGNKENAEFNQFKQAVYILEEDYQNLVVCKDYNRKFNPLKPFAWLLVGLVSLVVAAVWIVHIGINMLVEPAVRPFLNEYLVWFDGWFPLFGVLSVAVFALYLLAACVTGCFKFGLRVVWFTLHPMKPHETYMNSFLFNCGIILLCASPVIQFTVQALEGYLRNTEVTSFFNVQVRYVRFFRFFYENNIFIYALLGFSLLSALYLVSCGRSRPGAPNPAAVRRSISYGSQSGDGHGRAAVQGKPIPGLGRGAATKRGGATPTRAVSSRALPGDGGPPQGQGSPAPDALESRPPGGLAGDALL